MAMTAWAAKFCTSSICLSVKGRTSWRKIMIAPTSSPSLSIGTDTKERVREARGHDLRRRVGPTSTLGIASSRDVRYLHRALGRSHFSHDSVAGAGSINGLRRQALQRAGGAPWIPTTRKLFIFSGGYKAPNLARAQAGRVRQHGVEYMGCNSPVLMEG